MAVDATTVLVRENVSGDASLNGVVDLTDFTMLAAHFNERGGAVWSDGDFNFDQSVDLSDFVILASNFNTSLTSDVADGTDATVGAIVPEPTTFATAALAATGLVCMSSDRPRVRRSVRSH